MFLVVVLSTKKKNKFVYGYADNLDMMNKYLEFFDFQSILIKSLNKRNLQHEQNQHKGFDILVL